MVTCMEEFLQHLGKFLSLLPKQIEGSPTAALTDLSKIQKSLQKMVDASKREQMKVVFLGSTSNGKSTILNALIKKTVLPFGSGSVTSCFCAISAVPPGQDCGTRGYVNTGGVKKALPVSLIYIYIYVYIYMSVSNLVNNSERVTPCICIRPR